MQGMQIAGGLNLFTVTLSIREHKYALTKDLSKYYQKVNADPLAQHLWRVMWRGGDSTKKMKVYVTNTVNFGDPAADPNDPRKVLGLIWETQEDRLMVDVKLNLGPKKAGLKLEEDVDLTSNIEGDLPGLITKRELWRVAQGQYDPLGLLCTYTVRFKIVMRSLAEEQSG
jgi:hypothetical protein